jgi:two-component system chemotaxis response regulator CheY
MTLRVLLVDDSRVMRKMILRVLRMCRDDTEVVEAEDGAEALRVWRPDAFDLYVFDINMPGLNGLMLLQALREREAPRRSPAIMVSTGCSDARRRQLDELGAVFVGKPFAAEALAAALQIALGAGGG